MRLASCSYEARSETSCLRPISAARSACGVGFGTLQAVRGGDSARVHARDGKDELLQLGQGLLDLVLQLHQDPRHQRRFAEC